ncbi:MAG: DUF2971 domain-containing protein [Thermoanaerobaculia bacterium]
MTPSEPPPVDQAAIAASANAVLDNYRDKSPVPTKVYHYTSLDAAMNMLESREVWCSNLRYSNDPSEAEYGKRLLDEVLDADPDLKLEGFRKEIADLDTYAASFSAESDLLPQWRAYCRNGRGVALGVDFDTLRQRKSMVLMRVIYDTAEQVQFVKDMLDVFRQPLLAARHDIIKLDPLARDLALYLAIIRSALKSTAYESEREYRLLDLLPRKLDGHHQGLQFRVSGGAVVPYLVANLTQSTGSFAAEPIREMKVGPCLDYSLIDASFTLYRSQTGRGTEVTCSSVSMRCE